MAPEVGRLLGLSDLIPISREQYDRTIALREAVRAVVDRRADYIGRHGKDPAIAMPAANWGAGAANDFLDAYRFVLAGDYDVVNRLRFYTQAFTGYQVMTFRECEGLQSVNPVPADFDERLKETITKPEPRIGRYLDLIEGLPAAAVARAPRMLGEIGWDVGGNPVNADVCAYQERLNFLHNSGVLPMLARRAERGERVNIVEIGTGYGALPYFIRRFVPSATYYLCDLPESLLFSSLYISLADSGFQTTLYEGGDPSRLAAAEAGSYVFVPNYAADDLAAAGVEIDLAVNTLSFGEMSSAQVGHYARLVGRILSASGLLFEQNPDNRAVLAEGRTCDAKAVLAGHFRYRRLLPSEILSRGPKPLLYRRGVAELWANAPVEDVLAR